MDILTSLDLVLVLGFLGILAFIVELIVQVTKEAPFIRTVPTKLYVLIISIILCIVAVFVLGAWFAVPVLWYYVVLAIFASFVVAYISIFGWDTFKEVRERYKYKKE